MIEFFRHLLRPDFMPHGYCFAWRPEILWLSVLSDTLITLSYISIPLSLIYFVRRRRDLSFNAIFYMFGAFIIFCGLTHALGVVVLWHPIYRLEVLVKFVTGLVSCATAITLYRIIPQALAYPSPSDLEEANAKLASVNLELEKKVAERTLELSRARDEAVSANLAKSNFLATMSHEIRTPLNGIIGTLSLLTPNALAPVHRDLFDTVRLSSDALLSIINDVLDFSKIEANKVTLEAIPFSPRQTVEEAMELNAPIAARKNLEVHTILPSNLPEGLIGDPARLRQILLNLVSNAIKFTPSGQVDCNVKILNLDSETASLRFEIVDTGIGISEAAQANLFRSFTQADSSTTRKFGGTGLGLAISKSLTELMGGRIGLNSAVGTGSTFWVELEFPVFPLPLPTYAPINPLSGKRVLIVDDNKVNLQIVRNHLEPFTTAVVEASSGAHALVALLEAQQSGNPFDLAIIDVEMPVMDGIMLTRAIRALPSTQQLQVLLLSSSSHLVDLTTLSELRIRITLAKPVHRDALRDAVFRVFSSEQSESPTGIPSEIRLRPGLRVLLAEDNAVNQKVARLMLERQGAVVYIADNGNEAFHAVRNQDFDAILMDCQMPELDGYAATRAIRAWEKANGRKPIPIIALTANVFSDAEAACIAAGMDGYLSKPLIMFKLVEKLIQFTEPKSDAS